MPRGGTLSSLGSSFEELIQGANQAREATAELRGELNNVQRETTRNAQMISSVIDVLTGNMNSIRQEIEKVVQGINNLSSASAQNRNAVARETATIDDLWEAYKKMGVEVDELNLNLKTLTFTEKEINKVVQLGTAYNRNRSDSYTALSEKYRAVKILIDNMTVAERENTQEGRNFVAMAREMYEQMNLLQQRTGKYQLQVGDYSKAMTGLNIATNQVIRELPVLANGVSMFAIAISNNIPILVDNIVQVKRSNEAQKALKKELLETAAAYELEGRMAEAEAAKASAAGIKTTSVVAALGKAVFSWQTALVLVLTVLPGLLKKIQEKKKAQEEEEKQQKELNEATKQGAKEMASLDQIYREARSSIQGEVTELQVLQVILDDTNRSWEDRVDAGKRLKQIFDEELEGFSAEEIAMGNAAEKMQLLTEEIYNQAKARANLNKITELTQKMIELEGDEQLYGNWMVGTKTVREYVEEIDKANKEGRRVRIGAIETEYVEKYRSIVAEMTQYQGQINELIAQISPSDLLEKLRKQGGRGGKNGGFDIPDLYYEMLQASAEALPYELDRNLAILEVGWMKQRDAYAKQIDELAQMRDAANADEAAEINQQIEYLINLLKLGQDKYDAEVKQIIKDRIASYAEEVVEDFVGEDIPEQIQEKMWSRRGRKYGGIVEAILAQTSKYGEGNKFGQGILKDEYVNFVTSVDQALKTSMGFMDDWMDKRLEMAKIAVEAAEKEVQAAQKVLDFEMEARANGYANRVETARKELDLEREQHRKALEEQRRLQNEQLLLDSISQASSLVTATANIWEAMTKGTGVLGPGLAIAATALLWGSYAASKIKAAQLAKMQSEQYGEGTVELLEGGSHASGHDIDLGVKKDGTRRRAEGGEFFAVINRRNSRKYRNVIPDVINSFNDGTFGDKYYNANAAMGNFALGLLAGGSPTDVSKLERDVRAIREQGDEHRYIDSMGNTIIRYKNLTRKIQK